MNVEFYKMEIILHLKGKAHSCKEWNVNVEFECEKKWKGIRKIGSI